IPASRPTAPGSPPVVWASMAVERIAGRTSAAIDPPRALNNSTRLQPTLVLAVLMSSRSAGVRHMGECPSVQAAVAGVLGAPRLRSARDRGFRRHMQTAALRVLPPRQAAMLTVLTTQAAVPLAVLHTLWGSA